MDLQNKVVIITGSSSGIGRVMALALAKAGAKIVLTARRQEKLDAVKAEIETLGSEAITVAGDITVAETATAIVDSTIDHFGQIDVLINNAGYAPPMSLLDTPENMWDVTIDTCLKSVYLMTRAALPQMLEQGGGRIVQISSVAGKAGFSNRTAYCAAKWGMQGFTAALRDEVGEQGIRLHTINPGAVATEWWGKTNDEQTEDVLSRMIQPQDIADAVLYVLQQPDNIQIDEVVVNTATSPWAEA